MFGKNKELKIKPEVPKRFQKKKDTVEGFQTKDDDTKLNSLNSLRKETSKSKSRSRSRSRYYDQLLNRSQNRVELEKKLDKVNLKEKSFNLN